MDNILNQIVAKREAELKSAFTRTLMKELPEFLILLQATVGAPDRIFAGNRMMSGWECKHATPSFKSPENQELFCARLARQAHCRYVIWAEDKRGEHQRTLIFHPLRIVKCNGNVPIKPAEAWCDGFDMKWLVEQVAKAHGL